MVARSKHLNGEVLFSCLSPRYYQTLATGDLTVSVVISDSQAGLNEVVFPDVFTASDGSTFDQAGSRGPTTVDSTPYAIDGSAVLDGVFNVIVSDMVDNQTASPNFAVIQDTVAPDVTFTMPDRVPLKIPISWQGLDEANVTGTPGAGIRHYDVEYKVGLAGTWTTLLAATPESAYPGDFVGMVGEEYYFRIQATDNVSNVSPWVEFGPVIVAPVTKYYSHGGQRVWQHLVALRQGDEVYYLHGDHLGSTSLTTDSDGAVTSEVRYHPYGQERWANGVAVTDFGFTSQRNEKGFNLHDYNARYYSSYLNRFISPDTIVPEALGSGGFNRYRYTKNNPLKYSDPTGHCTACRGVDDPLSVEWVRSRVDYDQYIRGKLQYNAYAANPDQLLEDLAVQTTDREALIRVAEAESYANNVENVYLETSILTEQMVANAYNEADAAGDTDQRMIFALLWFGWTGPGGGPEGDGVFTYGPDIPGRSGGRTGRISSENIRYTDKVLAQMQLDDFHGFPKEVDNFIDSSLAKTYTIEGGDGVIRTVVDIPGSYKNREGVFRYIIEPDDVTVNHRMFHPNDL